MRGTVRERSKGVWEVRAYVGRDPATGRPVQKSRTVRGGRRKAEDELRRLHDEIAKGKHRSTHGTVAHLLDRYLALLEEMGRSPTTLYGYRSAVRANIEPAIGHVRLSDLTVVDLDTLYSAWRSRAPRPMKPSTVHQQHSILAGALKQAERWGWIPPGSSPARLASPGNTRVQEPQPPDVDDVVRLLDVAKQRDRTLGNLLHLAAVTGARRGELCAIRWSDVDLERRRLTIDESVLSIGQQIETKDTKTHRTRRVSLDAGAAMVVAEQMRYQEAVAEDAGMVLDVDPFLFSHRVAGDQPVKPDRVTAFVRRLRSLVGLDGLKMHHLRHFMATQMLGSGVDVRTVAGRLGHSDASTTLRVYAHFLEERDRAAADELGGRLSPPALEPAGDDVEIVRVRRRR